MTECIKRFFSECENPNPPRPALSEHSISNPVPTFYSPPFVAAEDEDEEEEEEEEEEGGSRSEQVESLVGPMQHVGPTDDCSNNLGSDFHLLAGGHPPSCSDFQAGGGRINSWPIISTTFQPHHSG